MARPPYPSVPGVREVAEHAGVSRGTVSNVLNYPARVKPATRERVLKSIEELGFVPDGNARSLTLGHNNVVGLILPGLFSSFFVEVARGAQRAVQDAGCSLLIATIVTHGDDAETRQNEYMEYFDSTRARGILIAPVLDPLPSVRRAQKRGRPVITVNFDDPGLDACRVLVDEERAGWLAADELLRGGCRRLIWVGGQDDYQPVERRREGVRTRVAEEHGATIEYLDAGGLSDMHGEAPANSFTARSPDERPDGIVTASAALGASILRRLTAAGVAVPADIAIAACEGNTDEIRQDTPVTAAEVSGEEVGEYAVQLLMEEPPARDDTHRHRIITVTPSLVRRASTHPVPA